MKNKKFELKNGVSILAPIRLGMIVLLIVFVIFLQLGDKVSAAAMADVESAVTGSISMDAVEKSTARMFKNFYGLNASDYDSVVLYAPKTNMDAQELLIVKLADTSQAEAVAEAIEERRETQKNTFEGYAPEPYDMLENHSILDVRGNYILYVVHEDAAAADKAFKDSL